MRRRTKLAGALGIAALFALPITPTPAAANGALPKILPGVATVAEGNDGLHVVDVPVTLSAPSDDIVTALWSSIDPLAGSPYAATSGQDFVALGGTVVFQPGQTEATVPVVVRGDEVDELDELVVLSFRDPVNARMGGYWGLGFVTITSEEGPPPPTIGPGDLVQVIEGDSGETQVGIALRLSHPTDVEVSVEWHGLSTGLGVPQAVFENDYVPREGTLVFPAGTTEAVIDIFVLGDTFDEPDELIALELHPPTNATLLPGASWPVGAAVATATIIDDDDAV